MIPMGSYHVNGGSRPVSRQSPRNRQPHHRIEHTPVPESNLRNGCNVCSRKSFGRGNNSPASLERLAQSTRAWYWLNSVRPPSQRVPLSLEIVTTFGRSHGPKQPLIV